jgi:predicted RNA-binding protein associated with RNAse of E/G family
MPVDSPSLITIHKLDVQGKELWQYKGFIVDRDETKITIEAQFDREDVDIEGLQLRNGDRFVETFFFNQWYNIFAVYDDETKRFKGWYCNITRPAWLESQHLFAEDLALDLIVLPDQQITIVDQDEFETLNISTVDREKALEALNELIESARSGEGPFKPKGSVFDPAQPLYP